eukprot:scaffold85958_cov35-Attheya_sp.AAC.2
MGSWDWKHVGWYSTLDEWTGIDSISELTQGTHGGILSRLTGTMDVGISTWTKDEPVVMMD